MSVELHLGDCLEILPTLADNSVDAVITDPPYGIDYQSARRTDRTTWFPKLEGDNIIVDGWIGDALRLSNSCLFMFCRWDVEHFWLELLNTSGWNVKSQVIWDRVVHGLGDLKAQYAPQHDNAWFAVKNGYKFPNKRPKSVYRLQRLSADKLLHPTQKPIALMKRIITDLTNKGDTILDPFMGSGTTGVACVQTGRNFIGIEIEPKYYDIAEKRIKQAQRQMVMEI